MVATASCSKADGMPPPLKQRHPYICRPSHLFGALRLSSLLAVLLCVGLSIACMYHRVFTPK